MTNSSKLLGMRLFKILYLFTVFCLESNGLFANTTNSLSAVITPLCTVVDFVSGDLGKIIFVFAIIFLCIGVFSGKISWGVALASILGGLGILNATKIAEFVSGNTGAAICSTTT